MYQKMVLVPERVRRIPNRFSWVDHRLVRDGYFRNCSRQAMALYLLLLTVGDAQGISYYSDQRLGEELRCDRSEVAVFRQELIKVGLVAYRSPLCQVLALETAACVSEGPAEGVQRDIVVPEERPATPEEVSAIVRTFLEGC